MQWASSTWQELIAQQPDFNMILIIWRRMHLRIVNAAKHVLRSAPYTEQQYYQAQE